MKRSAGMMKRSVVMMMILAGAAVTALGAQEPAQPLPPKTQTTVKKPVLKKEPGLYATFYTSMGKIVCQLYEKEAPETVANFVGLAKGTKEWTHPTTRAKMKTPLYSGTVFHRVIPDFMIQGGDPLGNGTGNPGYQFKDEIVPGLTFDRPGRLAMANAGANTNGSQFFITEVPTPHLNGKHTIFGQVIEGQSLVRKIAEAGNSKTKLERVVIERVPQTASSAEHKRP